LARLCGSDVPLMPGKHVRCYPRCYPPPANCRARQHLFPGGGDGRNRRNGGRRTRISPRTFHVPVFCNGLNAGEGGPIDLVAATTRVAICAVPREPGWWL